MVWCRALYNISREIKSLTKGESPTVGRARTDHNNEGGGNDIVPRNSKVRTKKWLNKSVMMENTPYTIITSRQLGLYTAEFVRQISWELFV